MKRFTFLLTLLLMTAFVQITAQNKNEKITKVSGTVSDKDGPIMGASVKVKGTHVGTITGGKGEYSIMIPEGENTLVFSFIGLQSQEIVIKKPVINIIMQEKVNDLDEIVVVGYGEMKKRDLSGAISSVSAKSIDSKTPVNLFDALQGQVAGVEITTGSGAPGDESVIRIRGTGTLEGGANPLYVVDGVISDGIDDLNPNDIESIEVLKDAASAAIYGSRSANGVFLITTKQGDTTPRLNISYVRSYSKLARKMPASNAAERKYYDKVRRELTGSNGLIVTDSLANFFNQDQDMQDLIFRTAVRDEVNLTASGSNNAFKYYINAAYLNEDGIIVNSGYNRLTSRINMEYRPNKRLTLNSKVSAIYTSRNGTDESGVLNQLLERVPYWAVYNPDGSYVPDISSRRNPLAVAMTDTKKQQDYKFTIYESLKYAFKKYLSFSTNIQGNYSNRRSQFYRKTPQLHTTERSTGTDKSTVNYNWANENYFSFNKTFNKNHTVNAMVGNSVQFWHKEYLNFMGYDYTTDEIYTLNAASDYDIKSTYTKLSEHTMASFFGRIGYNYKSKYIFNANMRYDGSSRFGKDNRWGAFPSVSGAWRFSSESFNKWMKPFVDDAKLRISYGITGNEEIGDYAAINLYAPNYIYENNGTNVAGIGASNLGYEDFGWEETKQFNIGLDLNLMGNKLNIIVDYYKKITDNLLNKVQMPKETGFSTMTKNIGSMKNEGFEISANWEVLRKKMVQWSLSANFSLNRTRITQIADGVPFYKGSNSAIYVQQGSRLGEFYGYKYLGIYTYDESNNYTENWEQLTPIFQTDGTVTYMLNGTEYTGQRKQKTDSSGNILKGGDVNFMDNNGDGVINVADKTYIGCAQPDFNGGVSTSFSYGRFNLSASLIYSIGGDIYNYAEAKRNMFRQDGATPSPRAIQNMWTKPGDVALYPAPIVSEHNALVPSNFYLEDGSYIKLKSVKLSYSIPDQIINKVFLKKASFYIYGKNLLTFTKYTGYDPEFASNSDVLVMGIDSNRYPRKQEFGFGINLGF